MAAPPDTPTKSRGHSLFDRQAQLHARASGNKPSNQQTNIVYNLPLPQVKTITTYSTSPIIHRQPPLPPSVTHRESPVTTENYQQKNDKNVQLIGIHPRPESTYIKDWPLPPTFSSRSSEQYLETDFPLYENPPIQESTLIVKSLMPSDSVCCAVIEQAFDYLQAHDDDYDDIVQYKSYLKNRNNADGYDNEEHSDGGDSVDTIDLDATTSTNHQNDSKFYYSHCHY